MWTILLLTVVWVYILARVIVYFRSVEITGNWSDHRCEPAVMFTAGMYNTDPTKSNTTFATENFTYCTGQLAKSVLATVFAPILGILGGLMTGAEQGTASVGVVSGMADRLFSGLKKMLDTLFNRYQNTYLQLRMTLIHLASSMGRLHAAGIASVYMGISMIQGFFSAYEFVKKVCMIILGILLSLLFFLFFALLPVFPLILGVIAAVGAGGGMASEFCFPDSVDVIMNTGKCKRISDIVVGDVLHGNSVVEGVLEFDRTNVMLYNYKGIVVSGAHIVYDAGIWKPVCEVNGIVQVDTVDAVDTGNRLYCLITSSRQIHCYDCNGDIITFCDYEELNSDTMYTWWDAAVRATLNSHSIRTNTESTEGLHPHTILQVRNKGATELKYVRIGDEIRDIGGWTQVLGTVTHTANQNWYVCEGHLMGSEPWIRTDNSWARAGELGCAIVHTDPVQPIHLFTKSRTFCVGDSNNSSSTLRDSSEHDGSIDAAYMQKMLKELNGGM
jgi:hypothetical protein